MACAPSTRCAVRWIFTAGDRQPDRQRRIIQKEVLPRAHGHFPDRGCLISRVFKHPTEPALQIETNASAYQARCRLTRFPYAVPFGDEPFAAKDAQRFPHRNPAYAQQAAQLFLGRKPAIRAALRTGQFEWPLLLHIQGSRCSLTRLTSDDFSIAHPYVACQCFPLPKIRRKADISSSRFAEKDAMPSHAAPVVPVRLAKLQRKWQWLSPSCQHMPIHPPSQQRPCSSF